MCLRQVRLLVLGACVSIIAVSCTYLVVDSEPRGAKIFCSSNALGPWEEWRGGSKNVTPARSIGAQSTYCFFRVEKDGYFPSRPQLAELYPLRRSVLKFALEQTPESFAANQRARGLTYYRGEWVDPQAKGLVQYEGQWMTPQEKFDHEQEAKGLVKYSETWMTPAERDVAFAKDQKARGLAFYKNRWMTQLDFDRQSGIDEKVDSVQKEKTASIMRASISGKLGGNVARVRLLNATGEEVICLLSGPDSQQMSAGAYESKSVDLLPGDYRIVFLSPDVSMPFLGQESFSAAFLYSLTYQGLPLSAMEEKTLTREEIVKEFNLPEIKIPDVQTTPTMSMDRLPPGVDLSALQNVTDRAARRELIQRMRAAQGDRASSPSLERRRQGRPRQERQESQP